MKVYLIASEWRGNLNRTDMRVFNNLTDVILYAWDELEEVQGIDSENFHKPNYCVTTGLFRCYEFELNGNIKAIDITGDIKNHFVLEG